MRSGCRPRSLPNLTPAARVATAMFMGGSQAVVGRRSEPGIRPPHSASHSPHRAWKSRRFLMLSAVTNPRKVSPCISDANTICWATGTSRSTPITASTPCARWRTSRSRGTPISIYPDLIAALASIKQAAARTNRELGLLDATRADAIVAAAEEIRAGRLHGRVRGRRDPGRRRHLDQHERQRGDRQPRAGTARPAEGRLHIPASQRARQHEPEHQRRLSDGAQARGLHRHHAAGRRHGGAARGVRGEVRGVRGHPQDGPHPVAGRGADDARARSSRPTR